MKNEARGQKIENHREPKHKYSIETIRRGILTLRNSDGPVKSTLEKHFGHSFGVSSYFCTQKEKRWLRLKPRNLPHCPGEHSDPLLIGHLKSDCFGFGCFVSEGL